MLTQARLKQLLHYDPTTGRFTRLSSPRRSDLIGRVAGWTNKVDGYVYLRVDGAVHMAHVLAWFYTHGEWPKPYLDHKNRVRADNRLDNLRLATRAQNEQNKGVRVTNKSGVTGVYFRKSTGKWEAYISINNRQTSLGVFDKKGDAIITRRTAERQHFGEFASAA